MPTILIVEDELTIVQVLTSILQDEDYDVVIAGNGQEALQLLQNTRPDVILSDMMMPAMGGAELCKRLNSDALHSLIPLVLMSSAYSSVKLDGCRYAAFVKKPFVVDELLAIISKVIVQGSAGADS